VGIPCRSGPTPPNEAGFAAGLIRARTQGISTRDARSARFTELRGGPGTTGSAGPTFSGTPVAGPGSDKIPAPVAQGPHKATRCSPRPAGPQT